MGLMIMRLMHSAYKCAGNKKDNITVIYTPWSNLKKDGSMAVGQVGFKDQRKVSSMPHLHIVYGDYSLSDSAHPKCIRSKRYTLRSGKIPL